MNFGKSGYQLPDVSEIVTFSRNLLRGVSQREAKEFLRKAVHDREASKGVRDYRFAPPPRTLDLKRVNLLVAPCQYGEATGIQVLNFVRAQKLLLCEIHLDYFLANQHRIPERWKTHLISERWTFPKVICFWGITSLMNLSYVPYIAFAKEGWITGFKQLHEKWPENYYIAAYDPEF